ncbi:MAG: PqqD family protein [Bdellovibrionales bacterium]|nr:PqqD family protein [Bdellovibrionales bacterium]
MELVNSNYKVSSDIVFRTNSDGSIIVMKMDDSSNFYKIYGLASKLWTYISENKAISEFYKTYSEKYPENIKQLESDIATFVNELIQKKLIIQA